MPRKENMPARSTAFVWFGTTSLLSVGRCPPHLCLSLLDVPTNSTVSHSKTHCEPGRAACQYGWRSFLFVQAWNALRQVSRSKFGTTEMFFLCSHGNLKSSYW